MKTCYIDRSTGSSRDGNWAESLDLTDVKRIVVGMGPGSFAGIRSALAYAQGYALGKSCEVLGLPSACAIAADCYAADPTETSVTVVGDARQGNVWIAEFEGYSLKKDVYQIDFSFISGSVPKNGVVASPDDARIGKQLKAVFGERYLGERLPTPEGLKRFAEACPSILKTDPLPIYLNPAVRT